MNLWYLGIGLLWLVTWAFSESCHEEMETYGQVGGIGAATFFLYLGTSAASAIPWDSLVGLESLIGFIIGLVILIRR
jgi:hypothetical protein